MTGRATRVLLYAVGVSGLGQTRRAIRIAEYLQAATDKSVDVTVATGIPRCDRLFSTDCCQLITVPEVTDLLTARRTRKPKVVAAALLSLSADLNPDVFVSTTHAGLVGEVTPLIRHLGALGRRRVLAMRDIYWPTRFQHEFAALSARDFDQVVISAPRYVESWIPRGLMLGALNDRVAFVGYLRPVGAPQPQKHGGTAGTAIWCQVGGGRDGYSLAAAFLEAIPLIRRMCPSLCVELSSGVLMSGRERRRLGVLAAAAGVSFEVWTADPFGAPSGCHRDGIMLSMAGYNTCVEAAWSQTRTVLCPRRASEDDEQRIRADIFTERFDSFRAIASPEPQLISDALGSFAESETTQQGGVGRADFADPVAVAEIVLGEYLSH